MNRHALLALLFASLFVQSTYAAEPAIVGSVMQMRGAAYADHLDSSANLYRSMTVHVGDRIVTGRNARVALKMSDGAILTLGADTEFVIGAYSYSKKLQQGSAALELVKGAFRAVTGGIGKLKGRDFKVKTAAGVIGIRGTDFWGGFHFSEALDVALLGGDGIFIENAAGRIEITRPGEGTTVQNANIAPTAPKRWDDQKLNAAKQSVSWD
jgi:hypothetical protein